MVLQFGYEFVAVGLERRLLPAAVLLEVPDERLLAELAHEGALVDRLDGAALQFLQFFGFT